MGRISGPFSVPPPLFQLYVFLGLLNFACQVVAPGRAFSRRLIKATCKVTKPHHRIRVSQEMREDLKVWISFLSDNNGITVMLDNVWTSNETMCLFTDSADGRYKRFGIYFQLLRYPNSVVRFSYLTCSIFKAPTKCPTRGNNLAFKI
jgi:hypothetical protein